MSDRPMRAASRSRRPPGFAGVPPAQSPPAPPRETPEDASLRGAGGPQTPHDQEAPEVAAAPEHGPARDPYADAPSRQFNTRLLEPLHARYVQLVRELEAEGYRTTMTELLHALLDAGPTGTDEARELVRAWRRKREP